MRANFVWPNDQTVLLSVESSGEWSLWNRRRRQRGTCGWEKNGRPNSGDCEWDMMRENGKESKRLSLFTPTCLEPAAQSWTARGEILRVINVLFAPPVAYVDIAVACERKLGKLCSVLHPFEETAVVGKRFCKILENSTHLSCHPAVDHQELEDDDHKAENCHQLVQPEPWYTKHATRFSVHFVCWSVGPVVAWPVGTSFMLLELLPLALSGLKIGSNSDTELVSNFNCVLLILFKKTNDSGKSALDWIGAVAFPWLFKLIVHASSYRALSHHVLRVTFSCQFVQLLVKLLAPSCVKFRIATGFLDLESIKNKCVLLLSLFQNVFGLDRVHSDLLIHHAVVACLRPCKLHTKRLSERRTSRGSAFALLLQTKGKYRNCSHHFFTTKILNFVRDLEQIKTFEMFPECE